MDILVLLLCTVFVLSALALFWWLELRFKLILSVPILVLINETLRVYPGFVYGYLNEPGGGYALVICMISILALVSGFAVAFRLNPVWARGTVVYSREPFDISDERKIYWLLIFLAVLLVVPSLYLYQGFPLLVSNTVQILAGLVDHSSAYLETGEHRKLITKGHVFGGDYRAQGIIRALNSTIWPFLLVMTLAGYRATGSVRWLVVFVIALFLTFVFVAADGTRAPLINAMIVMMVAVSFLYRVRWRHVIVWAGALFLIAISLSVLSPKMGARVADDGFISYAIVRIAERIAWGNSINDVYAIELLQRNYLEHRMGALHWRDFVAAMPGVGGGTPFSFELFQILNPRNDGTTYLSGTYISTLYVDFGIVGVAVGFFVIGFFVSKLQSFLYRLPKNILGFALVISIIFGASKIVLNGFVSFLVFFVLIATAGLYFYIGISILDRTRKVSFSTQQLRGGSSAVLEQTHQIL